MPEPDPNSHATAVWDATADRYVAFVGLLALARRAHPAIIFEEGRLESLPVANTSLMGAVCWYSIINTPPRGLDRCLVELHRVIEPNGHLLLAFQSGDGEAVVRSDAYGTGLPLTSYRHGVADVLRRMETAGFEWHGTTERAPEFAHETTPQAFVLATRGEPTGLPTA